MYSPTNALLIPHPGKCPTEGFELDRWEWNDYGSTGQQWNNDYKQGKIVYEIVWKPISHGDNNAQVQTFML